jgi:hypothetical protein
MGRRTRILAVQIVHLTNLWSSAVPGAFFMKNIA